MLFLNCEHSEMSTLGEDSTHGASRRGLKSATLNISIRYSTVSCITAAPNGNIGFLYLAFTDDRVHRIARPA